MAEATSVLPSIDCTNPNLPPGAQGIARVAVLDDRAQLIVTFERPITAAEQPILTDPRSYALTGGQRLFPHALSASLYNPVGTLPDLLHRRVLLELDGIGDFSVYTLSVSGPDIDPFFAAHQLRFRLACDDAFDCRVPAAAAPAATELSVFIDYLAKDYSSFRQALLDFIPTRLPAWTERSEADIGIMLLELFAAGADGLSYLQDRVANEAFLDTATQRRSVAGHLALLGYGMDEGAAAYTWLQFRVNEVHTLTPGEGLRVTNLPLGEADPRIVFEPIAAATLRPEHNDPARPIRLYAWGNDNCCLHSDARSAALAGSFANLQAGDYLLFDDGRGRDLVQLVERPAISTAGPLSSPVDAPITVVRWSKATPLHRDYCVRDVVVSGNLVPATHGETIFEEPLRDLTPAEAAALEAEIADRKSWQLPPRQRLTLARAPLAHLDSATPGLASSASRGDSLLGRTARSLSTLTLKVDGGGPWTEVPTLLGSGPDDPVFRVEIDDQGDATVVFGDGTFGRRPSETAKVTATYRAGGGAMGNVGPDLLVVPSPPEGIELPWLIAVTNPLPAKGCRDLESRDHARRFAPATFHQPLVAVTAGDYEAAALDLVAGDGQPAIQRAHAEFRWTGSWLTVTLAVDPRGVEALDPTLEQALLAHLDARRLAGYDLRVVPALYVPIELNLAICCAPGSLPADVKQAVQQALSDTELPGGRRGFFHPENLTFGDKLYVSRIYATVMAVTGVESAEITRLARFKSPRPDQETAGNLAQGCLEVGSDEIVRLDNDRNNPQNGTLGVQISGVGS
jgi:hypothetical protein